MERLPMNDLLIILPGILGSVLHKDGKDLWAPSISAVSRVLQRETLRHCRKITFPILCIQ
jgi:hypothetical protein